MEGKQAVSRDQGQTENEISAALWNDAIVSVWAESKFPDLGPGFSWEMVCPCFCQAQPMKYSKYHHVSSVHMYKSSPDTKDVLCEVILTFSSYSKTAFEVMHRFKIQSCLFCFVNKVLLYSTSWSQIYNLSASTI